MTNDLAALSQEATQNWTAHNMVHAEGRPMTAEELGEYVTNSVKMSDETRFLFISGQNDEGEDVDVCHVGNGPNGPNNAAFIVTLVNAYRTGQLVEAPVLGKTRTAIALMNSMILSGEEHSETSRAIVAAALAELDAIPTHPEQGGE